MPATPFSKEETAFLAAYLTDWIARGKEQVKAGQTSPRTRLEREIVDEFWESFPDRKDGGARAFDEGLITSFRQIIHQWFSNKARPHATKTSVPVDQNVKQVTARTLFVQNHKADIHTRAQEIRSANPEMNQMTAWNKATAETLQTAQEGNPEEYQRLKDIASRMRESQSADYTERTTEDLTRVLHQLPKMLVAHAQEWSRTTGAVFFMLALYELPGEPGLQSVEALSPSISGFSKASEGTKTRELIIDWVVDELGASLSRNPDSSQLAVYPDKHNGMRPVMPHVSNIQTVHMKTLRPWIRDFLNALYRWQGGESGVPWTRALADSENYFVQSDRLPSGESTLPDLNRITKPDCVIWFHHLQRTEEPRFQFRRVLDDAGRVVASYETFCASRHPHAVLDWTPESKLYARYVDTKLDAKTNLRAWKSLPLARTQGIYTAISPADVTDLAVLSKRNVNLTELAELINKLEGYGPAHLEDPALIQDTLNAHFPESLPDARFQDMLNNTWAPVALFDEDHEDYDSYALSTLAHWIKTSTRFRHVPTGTWRGGPHGVRWNLAALTCIVSSLTAVNYRIKVPAEIQRVAKPDTQERLWRQASQVANWLIRSVQQSIDNLSKTFDQRAQAWQAAVLAEYYNQQLNPLRSTGARSTPVADSTSGVPTDPTEIHAYAQNLIQAGVQVPQQDPDTSPVAVAPAQGPKSGARARRPGKQRQLDPYDDSFESFDLDAVSDTTQESIPVLKNSSSDERLTTSHAESASEEEQVTRMELPARITPLSSRIDSDVQARRAASVQSVR
ncbi:hypothetical protein BDV93DRAFT_565599 [Ceratobasidium sp. AG-I]|nr:hypothetical protein BDV93DRAFT_565599 [Ceratobasidium sp. AG-I]